MFQLKLVFSKTHALICLVVVLLTGKKTIKNESAAYQYGRNENRFAQCDF